VIAWLIVLGLLASATVGYWLWLHGTAAALCRAGRTRPVLRKSSGS
jgi:hypothetical protein